VCGHELGHAIMHTGTNEIYMDTRTFLKTSIYERQADKFSVNLIYPDDDYFMDFQGFSISKIAECLGLDEWLVEYRLKCLNK
jgi:Zn-dependent peptidase ImmA (M78 family)